MNRKFVVRGLVLPCVAVAVMTVSSCSSPQAGSSPDESGRGTSSASGMDSSLVYPDLDLAAGQIPQEATAWLSEELASFTHPFPSEAYLPATISDLNLGIDGAVSAEQDGSGNSSSDDTLHLQMAAPGDDGVPTFVSVSRGDVYSTMADRWYCAWVDEYLQATDASDTAREKRALDYLTGFTDDKLVAQFATNVPIYQESVLTPLEQSDVEPARSSVKTCEVFTGK